MFVWWDGKVNPCDVDYRSKLLTGSIVGSDIKSIWNSEYYNNLRLNHINKKRETITPCNKCSVV